MRWGTTELRLFHTVSPGAQAATAGAGFALKSHDVTSGRINRCGRVFIAEDCLPDEAKAKTSVFRCQSGYSSPAAADDRTERFEHIALVDVGLPLRVVPGERPCTTGSGASTQTAGPSTEPATAPTPARPIRRRPAGLPPIRLRSSWPSPPSRLLHPARLRRTPTTRRGFRSRCTTLPPSRSRRTLDRGSRPDEPAHERAVRWIVPVHSGRSRPGVPIEPARLLDLTAGDLELRPGWLGPPAPEVVRPVQPAWTSPAVGRLALASRPLLSAGGGFDLSGFAPGPAAAAGFGQLRLAGIGERRGEVSFDPEPGWLGVGPAWPGSSFLTPPPMVPHVSAQRRILPHMPPSPSNALFAPFRGNA